jgi:plasmid stabilization system protein ParE
MAHAVIFSAQSNRDLGQIVVFLAGKNPTAAERLGEGLIEHALKLGALPYLGPAVRGRPDVRRILHKPWFVIYYRVDDERRTVEIVRFWDARQNPDELRLG